MRLNYLRTDTLTLTDLSPATYPPHLEATFQKTFRYNAIQEGFNTRFKIYSSKKFTIQRQINKYQTLEKTIPELIST